MALRYNLGAVKSAENTRAARGQRLRALNVSLPQIGVGASYNREQYIAALAPDVGESVAANATRITSAAWKITPSWYLLVENDRALSTNLQQLLATRMEAITLRLPTSDVPMLSQPYDVAAFIRSAAGQPD